jgi:Protein of unknown function (DUF3102)
MNDNDTLNTLAAGIREELAAIETDSRSALGHAIAAGKKLTEAKALVKHGEWLPWLKKNFPASERTANDYMKLAANPQRAADFSSVREALNALKKPPAKKAKASTNSSEPTSEPKAKTKTKDKPTITGKQGLSHYPAVIAWVRDRIREGWDRNRIVAASKAGSHGWPLPGEALSNGGVSECRAVIAALEQAGVEPNRDADEGERRERRTKREVKSARNENLVDLLKLQERLGSIVRFLETTDFHAEYELNDIAIDALMALADDLVATIDWCQRALPVVQGRMGRAKVLELVRKLETVNGRTPEEAEPFLRRAQLLRREYDLL